MSNNNASSGIGFVGILTIIFVALKLTGGLGWSWWFPLTLLVWFLIFVATLPRGE